MSEINNIQFNSDETNVAVVKKEFIKYLSFLSTLKNNIILSNAGTDYAKVDIPTFY